MQSAVYPPLLSAVAVYASGAVDAMRLAVDVPLHITKKPYASGAIDAMQQAAKAPSRYAILRCRASGKVLLCAIANAFEESKRWDGADHCMVIFNCAKQRDLFPDGRRERWQHDNLAKNTHDAHRNFFLLLECKITVYQIPAAPRAPP